MYHFIWDAFNLWRMRLVSDEIFLKIRLNFLKSNSSKFRSYQIGLLLSGHKIPRGIYIHIAQTIMSTLRRVIPQK